MLQNNAYYEIECMHNSAYSKRLSSIFLHFSIQRRNLPLFVVLRAGCTLDAALKSRIAQEIRGQVASAGSMVNPSSLEFFVQLATRLKHTTGPNEDLHQAQLPAHRDAGGQCQSIEHRGESCPSSR